MVFYRKVFEALKTVGTNIFEESDARKTVAKNNREACENTNRNKDGADHLSQMFLATGLGPHKF